VSIVATSAVCGMSYARSHLTLPHTPSHSPHTPHTLPTHTPHTPHTHPTHTPHPPHYPHTTHTPHPPKHPTQPTTQSSHPKPKPQIFCFGYLPNYKLTPAVGNYFAISSSAYVRIIKKILPFVMPLKILDVHQSCGSPPQKWLA
jgi:hypothetical protein